MKNNFSDDTILIDALAKGNKDAFTFLMDSYHKKLCVYALSLCQDYELAEDIIQNVFLKIWKKREKINKTRRLSSFLYRSVYNEFIDQYRQTKKVLPLEKKHIDALSSMLDEEKNSDIDKLVLIVNKEIENLPNKCKKVFLLSKKEGLTNFEIADYLKITVKSVEAHITKGYKILKQKISK